MFTLQRFEWFCWPQIIMILNWMDTFHIGKVAVRLGRLLCAIKFIFLWILNLFTLLFKQRMPNISLCSKLLTLVASIDDWLTFMLYAFSFIETKKHSECAYPTNKLNFLFNNLYSSVRGCPWKASLFWNRCFY